MKIINVQISDDSIASSVVQNIKDQIPGSTKLTPEYQIIFGQVIVCVEDFIEKAIAIAGNGTTIYMKKTFSLPEINILITLEYPRKTSLINKLKAIFKRS